MSQLFSDHTLRAYDSARLCLSVSNFTLMQASITARLQQTGADHAVWHTRLDISTAICMYLHEYALYLWCVCVCVTQVVTCNMQYWCDRYG